MQNHHESVGLRAKSYHLAARTMIESILRRYDLGQMLKLERATLSAIVATLVRKGLVDQTPDAIDQRQRVLHITAAGTRLWEEMPDPIALTFDGPDSAELAVALRVLQQATQRLNDHMATERNP